MHKTTPAVIALVSTAVVCLILMLTCAGMVGVFIIFGADQALRIVLVNDSGQGLTVTTGTTKAPLAPSAQVEVIPKSTRPVLVVQTTDGRTWKYNWVPLPGSGSPIYMQIEADGAIYVVPGKARGVSKTLPAQPPGYPLKPQ